MGGADFVPLGSEVKPREIVDISVPLTAPNESGLQRGFWMLQNPAETLFGVGTNGDLPFYVVINVSSGTGQNGNPTPTDFATGSGSVSGLAISAATPSYRGECPFTFTFNVQVTMASPDRVTLQLEAGASDPTYQFSLPPAQSYNLGVGPNAFSYFLELTDSVDGWVQIRLTAPETLVSNQATFSLTCE
jgi:hypothetical protein